MHTIFSTDRGYGREQPDLAARLRRIWSVVLDMSGTDRWRTAAKQHDDGRRSRWLRHGCERGPSVRAVRRREPVARAL